jgi:phospholipase D-like protein
MATSTRGSKYWHATVRWGRCNVRDMEGLAASVVLLAILLGVLLVVVFDVFCLLHLGKADTAHFLPKFVWAVLIVCISPIGGLVYLLAQRLPKRSPEPPAKPVNRGLGLHRSSWSCSSSGYGWGLSQPHTPPAASCTAHLPDRAHMGTPQGAVPAVMRCPG